MRVTQKLLILLLGLLLLKMLVVVVGQYGRYLPADFAADFLQGREAYFHGWYGVAFYGHILTGPLALILGTGLISRSIRRRPNWHRRLGRIQLALILAGVAPSGLAMAWHAEAGWVAGAGFACLASLTACFATLGWRAAKRRRYDLHRGWMLRCYALIFSAVVLRVQGGVAALLLLEPDQAYRWAAWTSWLIPLLIAEWWLRSQRTARPPRF